MYTDFNIAPTTQMLGVVDPRLGQAVPPASQATPEVVEAEIVDVPQGRADRAGERGAELRLRQRAQMEANRPVLSGPTSYGADGKPRYVVQTSPGALFHIIT